MTPYPLLILLLALAAPHLSKAERSIYLNSLDLTYFVAGTQKTLADQTPEKKALIVGSQQFNQGIWTHAPATAKLKLPPDALFLSATVGVQKQADDKGSVRFLVRAEDNSILFDSGLMKGTTPPRDFEISLEGHKSILLVTDPGPDGTAGDQAVWGQPRLIVSGKGTPPPAFVRNDTLTSDFTSLQMPVETPVEGLLLGNGTLGTSVWGAPKNLRFSLDLAGLWTFGPAPTTPSLAGLNPDSASAAFGQTASTASQGSRRVPLGRLEIKHNYANTFHLITLNHKTGTINASFSGAGAMLTSYIHAEEPVLVINTGPNKFQPLLSPPEAVVALGLAEPAKGVEDIPEGQFSWFSLATTPKVTFVGTLHRPKSDALPFTHFLTAETADTVEAAREAVLERLRRVAAADPKAYLKAHTDWWKKYHETVRMATGSPEWNAPMGLARYVLGASARGSGEPGGRLWTFEKAEAEPLRTGYPANAPLFAAHRLGFAETAESQARWHLARLDSYRAHAKKNFGIEGIIVPGLLRPDGFPDAISAEALAPALSAQAAWPFLLAAKLNPASTVAKESSLPWAEDSAKALSALSGGGSVGTPLPPWGTGQKALVSWQDTLLLRSAFSGAAETTGLLGDSGGATRWAGLSGRVTLPSSAMELSPGVTWSPADGLPTHLIGHHPLQIPGLPAFSLPADASSAMPSARLWLACAAARSDPEAAAALALSVPLRRNGLPIATTADSGGVQGLTAQTLELMQNFLLSEAPDGAAEVFSAVPKSWPTASIKDLPLTGGARISAEWAKGSVLQIALSSAKDTEVLLADTFGQKGFKTSHKAYRRASGRIIISLKAGETAVLKAP